ncbi:MAG: hypothetical protein PHQ52_03640 [Candidatus Omnitrophica bacterium]|nr:hypothetical protein [Candidatus Omnitrophota bacterium]
MEKRKKIILVVLIACVSVFFYSKFNNEKKMLKQIITRLEADSRIAQVLVTNVTPDEANDTKFTTTIKFLEYDSAGKPMPAKYFTFTGNLIQFQALVVRYDDLKIRTADKLKGKSAYLFMKAFALNGKDTEEFVITEAGQVPGGYKVGTAITKYEQELWANFWDYILNNDKARKNSIKNAQIEAPGTMFIPGMLYTIKIEHDGGMRIDAVDIPDILKGERILV